jgi:hypothetical protein
MYTKKNNSDVLSINIIYFTISAKIRITIHTTQYVFIAMNVHMAKKAWDCLVRSRWASRGSKVADIKTTGCFLSLYFKASFL